MDPVRPALAHMHAFTSRADGNMSTRTGDDALSNRQRLFERLGISAEDVVFAEQVHGRDIARVGRADRGRTVPNVDGLVSDDPGVFPMLFFADCVPIVLSDPMRAAVGVAHAGWRGTAAAIAATAVGAMRDHLGTDPADLLAWIGPAIGQCCYEVSDDVARAVQATCPHTPVLLSGPRLRPMLDLQAANRAQLLGAGLRPENVLWRVTCTACQHDRYFSHRTEAGRAGRIAALIGLRPEAGQ